MVSVVWEEHLWSADLQACCQCGPVDSVINSLLQMEKMKHKMFKLGVQGHVGHH